MAAMLYTVPTTSMPHKDERQHYKTALLSSRPNDFQRSRYDVTFNFHNLMFQS